MPYTILPVEDDDVPRASELICDSIVQDGIQEYMAAIWPGMNTLEGRKMAVTRLRKTKSHLPDPSHFLKVIDDDTGGIVATSICFYNPEPPTTLPPMTGNPWTTDDDREYAHFLKNERDACVLRAFAPLQGPVDEVLAFFVDASKQRQGIGTFLMNHLLSLSAKRRAPVLLIAYPTAKGFYEKVGFRCLEDAVVQLPEKWQGKGKGDCRIISMYHDK